jgi:hypothetical protein
MKRKIESLTQSPALSPTGRLLDALWLGDADRARAEIARSGSRLNDLDPLDKALLPAAAWWYR